jgi:septal ring-binding cell division protein DamX
MNMAAAELLSPASGCETAGGSPSLPLLSAARMQKFDLLLHFAVNLPQPIVVCGPEGIGKTTFLRLLETRLSPFTAVCYLASAPNMGYVRVLDELSRALNRDRPGLASAGADLADLLDSYAKERRSLVLLLDDAGALVPGALGTFWQFASRHPALRVVLAMRTDEAAQKSGLDKSALADAFTLEIPALSEDDCEVFARQLRTRWPGVATARQSTESLAKRLYAESGGIPGKLIEILESPHESTSTTASAMWLIGSGLLAGAAFLTFMPQSPVSEQSIPGSPVSGVAATRAIAPRSSEQTGIVETSNLAKALTDTQSSPQSSPLADNEKADTPPISETAVPIGMPAPQAEANETGEDQKPREAAAEREPSTPSILAEPKSMPEEQTEMAREHSVPTNPVSEAQTKTGPLTERDNAGSRLPETVAGGLKGAEWLMRQSPDAYTLQIVAVSRPGSLLKLAGQFQPGSQLASFRSRKGNGELYPLFFGIYPSLPAAKDAAAHLPASLGQPLPRQLKSIHQEIRRMMPRQERPISSADSPVR